MYTIGQLAEIVGISPKALRIYEKKGMLQPMRSSQNNYRLYDETAKIELQKIVMLKFLGFSLDQIKEFLEDNKDASLEESFVEQKYLLEQKKKQLETVISCMDRAIWECQENKLNMDKVLETMNHIIKNRKADEMVWELEKFSPKAPFWNCWVFEQAKLQKGEKVLDAGAGWGNLWRKNWDKLPEGIAVTCIDKHNTWADEFADYIGQQEANHFSFLWGDLEEMKLPQEYDCIFFNHTAAFMQDGTCMLQKFSDAMEKNGKLICTWGGLFAIRQICQWIKEYGTGVEEVRRKTNRFEDWHKEWECKLQKVFGSVEKRVYEVELYFERPEDCMEYIFRNCKELRPLLESQKRSFLSFLSGKSGENGVIEMKKDTYLYLCTKEGER